MSERPVHGQDEHFDELLAGRVVTEAMTQFPEGTPLMEVLEWLHERLSLSETGAHVVTGMSMDAEYFQPTHPIDAIKHEAFGDTFTMNARFPITPIDPEFIPMGAWLTGKIVAAADIKAERPVDKYFLYDEFSNQQDHTWGQGSTVGSYTYQNPTHEWNHLKADFDPEPADFVYDYQGRVIENGDTGYRTYVNDEGLMNKRVRICTNFAVPKTTQANYKRIEFRGTSNYVRISAGIGGDNAQLVVDGGNVGSSVALPGRGSQDPAGYWWFHIEALDNVVRMKVWADGDSEPATWTRETDTASLTPGRTAIHYDGRKYHLVVTQPNGSPWTHYTKFFSVQGINAGPIHTSAYLRPAPFAASAWLSSGDDVQIDAFVLPTFRIDAQLVDYVPGNFTIGGFKEDRVEESVGMDAFVGGYGNIDAVIGSDAVFGQHTVDAWKVITTEDSVVTDAIVHDIDRTYPVTADAITKGLDLSGAYQVNAYKNLLIEGSHEMDAWIGPGAHPPMDAIIHDTDRLGDFTMNATTWPEGVELFVINAVKHQPDSDIGALGLDAQLKYVGERHEHPHWDDFNRAASDNDVVGWGAASHSGTYTYSDAATTRDLPVPTAGGENYGHWNVNTGGRVTYSREPLSIDRKMWMDVYIENGGGISIGYVYFYVNDWVRVQKYHANGGSWYFQVYYDAVWNTLHTHSIGLDNDWKSMRFEIDGTNVKYKAWDRSGSEPGWLYDDSPPWTPTGGLPRFHHSGESWFGGGGNPWDQRVDNWFVTGTGFPFVHDADSVFKTIDNPGSVAMDSVFVPQPFTMDAFIEGYGNIDARIWLGTTYPKDAIIERPQLFPDSTIGYSYLYGGNTSWSHTPPANAKYLIVSCRQSGAVTFGGVAMTYLGQTDQRIVGYQYGITAAEWKNKTSNTIVTNYAGGLNWSTFLTSLADIEYVGRQYTASKTVTMNDTIDGMASRAMYYVFTGGKSGSPWPGFTPYQGDGAGYQLGGTGVNNPVTGWGFAAELGIDGPDKTSLTAGVVGAGGVAEGDGYLFQAASSNLAANAWIRPGAHIPFDAQLTGHHIHAILKTVANPYDYTMDMTKHQLGEQLKSLSADAWAAAYIAELYKTQFGDLELGRLMWGDVTPEREQLHGVISAIIRAAQTDSVAADAYLESPYLPEVLESILGEMTLGEDGMGWALRAFSAAAVIKKPDIAENFTSDAILDIGHFRADASVALAGGTALWNYGQGRTGDWAEATSAALQDWEGAR